MRTSMLRLGMTMTVHGSAAVADFFTVNDDGTMAELIRSRTEPAQTAVAAQAIKDEWRLAAEVLGIEVHEQHPRRAPLAA